MSLATAVEYALMLTAADSHPAAAARLRLTVREMNYAARRIVEVQAPGSNLTDSARRPG
jgi:hypothetical protein